MLSDPSLSFDHTNKRTTALAVNIVLDKYCLLEIIIGNGGTLQWSSNIWVFVEFNNHKF